METTRDTKRALSLIGFASLAFVIVNLLLGLVIKNVAVFQTNNQWLWFLIHTCPVYLFVIPAYLVFLSFIPKGAFVRPKERMKLSRVLMIFFAFSAVAGILDSGIGMAITAVPFFTYKTTVSNFPQSGVSAALIGLLGALIAGFGEEFVFRKKLYEKMAGCPDIFYILVSGITFGILHTFFAQGIGTCFLGFAFAYIYLRTRNYFLVVILHALNDIVSLFVVPLVAMVSPVAYRIPEVYFFITIVILIFTVIEKEAVRRRKELLKYMRPAEESGWAFASAKLPFKAVFSSVGTAICAAVCFGIMVWHLF